MSFLRRLLTVFALATPAVALAAPTEGPASAWPAEPGPLSQDLALPLDVGGDTVRKDLPRDQRALVDAWSTLHHQSLDWGVGGWGIHLQELEQDWFPGVRFISSGGYRAGGHSVMSRTVSALSRGHLVQVSYRSQPGSPALEHLVALGKEGEVLELGAQVVPVLLERARGEELEPQVRELMGLLLSLRSSGSGRIVDIPDQEGALARVPVPGLPFSVTREGDRIEARGTFVASSPLWLEAGHVHLIADPSGLFFEAKVVNALGFTAY